MLVDPCFHSRWILWKLRNKITGWWHQSDWKSTSDSLQYQDARCCKNHSPQQTHGLYLNLVVQILRFFTHHCCITIKLGHDPIAWMPTSPTPPAHHQRVAQCWGKTSWSPSLGRGIVTSTNLIVSFLFSPKKWPENRRMESINKPPREAIRKKPSIGCENSSDS